MRISMREIVIKGKSIWSHQKQPWKAAVVWQVPKRSLYLCLTHIHVAVKVKGLFSPPMLQMMLLSHTAWFCSFLHSRTEPMAESAVGFIQHHLNWVKLKGALCICSSPWAAKGKSGQSWDHTQRGWAQHPDSSWDLSTMLCPSDAPYLQGAMVAWCGVWYVVVTYQRKGPA